MNTIAIIENKPNDFDSVKKMFKASNVWPTDFSEFWKKTPQKNLRNPISIMKICWFRVFVNKSMIT